MTIHLATHHFDNRGRKFSFETVTLRGKLKLPHH